MLLLLVLTVAVVNALFESGAVCVPLSDQGPHVDQGWGQVVRLRHLYAARPGLHLLIGADGQIQGSADQTLHSKIFYFGYYSVEILQYVLNLHCSMYHETFGAFTVMLHLLVDHRL